MVRFARVVRSKKASLRPEVGPFSGDCPSANDLHGSFRYRSWFDLVVRGCVRKFSQLIGNRLQADEFESFLLWCFVCFVFRSGVVNNRFRYKVDCSEMNHIHFGAVENETRDRWSFRFFFAWFETRNGGKNARLVERGGIE